MRKILLLITLSGLISTGNLLAQSDSTMTTPGNGKSYGLAVNPVLALFDWYSGEFNIWNLDRTAEINIPFQYMINPFGLNDETFDLDVFSIGIQYRKFFDEDQEGFFVQAGLQYFNATTTGKGIYAGESAGGNVTELLFGIGYRMISKSTGLFWAASLSAGKGWGTVENPAGDSVSASGFAYDIDILKIGYAW